MGFQQQELKKIYVRIKVFIQWWHEKPIIWLRWYQIAKYYLLAKSRPGTAHASGTKFLSINFRVHTNAYGDHDMLKAIIIKRTIKVTRFSRFSRFKLFILCNDFLSLLEFCNIWEWKAYYELVMYLKYLMIFL